MAVQGSGKSDPPKDPWLVHNSWSDASSTNSMRTKQSDKRETVLLDLADEDKATSFEKKLVHAGDVTLAQAPRWRLSSDSPQVVLVDGKYVMAVKAALGKALPSMIFVERLANHLVKTLQAVKTRVTCKDEGGGGAAKVLELWAVRASEDQEEVGIVHLATAIVLSLPSELRVTLKLREEHAATEDEYVNFGLKGQLARFFGPIVEHT